jgi:hypothetical protein
MHGLKSISSLLEQIRVLNLRKSSNQAVHVTVSPLPENIIPLAFRALVSRFKSSLSKRANQNRKALGSRILG